MDIETRTCQNCAAEVDISKIMETRKCIYCGSNIIISDTSSMAEDGLFDNLLKLVDIAFESSKDSDAYKYCTKILESDARNGKAWLGKGKSAYQFAEASACLKQAQEVGIGNEDLVEAWLYIVDKANTLENILMCYTNAYKFGLKDEELLTKSSIHLNNIAINYYNKENELIETKMRDEKQRGKSSIMACIDGSHKTSMRDLAMQSYNLCSKTSELLFLAWKLKPSITIVNNIVFNWLTVSKLQTLPKELCEKALHISNEWEREARKLYPTWTRDKFYCVFLFIKDFFRMGLNLFFPAKGAQHSSSQEKRFEVEPTLLSRKVSWWMMCEV